MDAKKLQQQVDRSRYLAVGIALSAIAFYFWKAWRGAAPPDWNAAWGQFGDFVGGVLNPVIAYFALYWLTQSVILQRAELQDTKDALADAARSQADQARNSERIVEIAALTALLQSIDSQVVALHRESGEVRDHLRTLGGNILTTSSGIEISGTDNKAKYIRDCTRQIFELRHRHGAITSQLERGLASSIAAARANQT